MNKYLKKNYCLDKNDMIDATDRVISILEKKKKVIIAHDKGKRKNAILGNTIKYIINSAKNAGVKKPKVLYVSYLKHIIKRSNSVIYVSELLLKDISTEKPIVEFDEEVVAIIVDDFEALRENILGSSDLLNFINEVKHSWKVMYEVITMGDLFSHPVLLPYITFRIIDYKYSKILGIEGSDHLADFFYDRTGIAQVRDTGFLIHKRIAEYIDIDLYNYVDENNLIIPEIYKHKSAEDEVIATLKKIKDIDIEDGAIENRYKKRFHLIICNNLNLFLNLYWDIFKEFAENEYMNIGRISTCEDIKFFGNWQYKEEFIDSNKLKNTTIFIVKKDMYSIAPWYILKDRINSINLLSTTNKKEIFPMSLKDFMNAYEIAYKYDNRNKNKIFVYCRSDYISYDNYTEMDKLLSKELQYDFNMNILRSFYNKYILFGNLNKGTSKK